MSTFTWTPSFGANKTLSPKIRSISFGDGYEQRASFGINNNPQTWSLSFINRNDTETGLIDSFLSARKGVESFDWTPYNGSQGKYVCKEWSISIDNYNGNTIQATFQQVFE